LSKKSTKKAKAKESKMPIKLEIRGIVFLILAIILGVSFFSFHPVDRLIWNVTGSLGNAQNLFGTVGAHLADGSLLLIGFSSYWLVIICLVMAFLSFKGQAVSSPLSSLFSTLALIISFSGILSLHFEGVVDMLGGTVIAGGLVGLHLASFSINMLNQFGAWVFFLSIFVISLMISTHLSLGWLLSIIGTKVIRLLKLMRDYLVKIRERKKRSRKTTSIRKEKKPKRKVTIIEPKAAPKRKPEQKSFLFHECCWQIQPAFF